MPYTTKKLGFFIAQNFTYIAAAVLGAFAWFSMRRRQGAEAVAKGKMQQAVSRDMAEPISLHPHIDPAKCLGCGACVRACPEGDILQMINHRAVLVAPTKCVGHGQCEASCPFDAISLVFGTKTRGLDIPRISTHYETNVSGLYIVGELGGMGLIRNATKQGKMAVEHAARKLNRELNAEYDLLIVGAGPAGIAATLTAKALKLNYLTIDQGKFGGTIANFPRQKLVMTQPVHLPLMGVLKFPDHKVSKENLMSLWMDMRQRFRLRIKENVKFTGMETVDGVFRVKTDKGDITARKVALAMGVRGSPRKLGVVNENLSKVTYSLIEPEQYRGKHVAVVGGGNAAAETAIELCRSTWQNQVWLLVRSAAMDRCNEENEQAVLSLAKSGKLRLLFSTSVTGIEADTITLSVDGKEKKIKNDYLFVMAGTENANRMLQGLGIKIDTKFGEPLKKAD